MSQDNVELMRRFMAGLAGGTPTALEMLDPQIAWHVEDTLPDPQVWHGHEGVEQFFAGLREVWRELRFSEGRVVRLDTYFDRGRALDAAGLRQ